MTPTPITLARAALARRESLAGAGREIMASFGLDRATAERLWREEKRNRKEAANADRT